MHALGRSHVNNPSNQFPFFISGIGFVAAMKFGLSEAVADT
jgi:hypothetical protein